MENKTNETEVETKPKHGEKYNHPGSNNLITMNEMTEERQREIASMGGKASQAKAKERKRAREIAQAILASDMTDTQVNRILGKDKGMTGGDVSAYAVMMAKMVLQACKGDSKAATFMRDTAGDKPDDNMNVATVITEGDKALLAKLEKRLGMEEK